MQNSKVAGPLMMVAQDWMGHTILYSVHNSSVCVKSGWCTGSGGGGVFVM